MFYYLDGTVAEILPGLAVIDCGGVGYACMTTNNTLSQLKKGEKKKLYTYLNVGESIFDLYGFATQNELNSFKLLLGVSGVGPKAALAILSANTPEGLAMAIVTARRSPLCLPARPPRLLRRWRCWAIPRKRCRWPSRAWMWRICRWRRSSARA